jgi:hypothetical protein
MREAARSFIDLFSWIVLLVLVATLVAVVVALGMMPGRIAHRRAWFRTKSRPIDRNRSELRCKTIRKWPHLISR